MDTIYSSTEIAQNRRLGTCTGMVFDVKRFAIHDGPGLRTTLFLKGCPLRCDWCHNPESQSAQPEILFLVERCTGCGLCVSLCPQEAIAVIQDKAVTRRSACTGCGQCVAACPVRARRIVGELRTLDSLLAELQRDILFFDQSGGGVTLSGGEPLAQPVFSSEVLRRCRELRIHTALDTSGYCDEATLDQVAEFTDLFLFDIKLLDEDRHIAATGVSNHAILRNLSLLSKRRIPLWIRYPLIPGINDAPSDLAQMGEFIAGLPRAEAVQILPYHRTGERKLVHLERDPGLRIAEPPSSDAAQRAAQIVRQYVTIPVTIGG